ncbi:MAG: F0F1 ATP synthase subunit A [Verrucomicrobiales bacterium]|nr:F0F1 ATP synthase subunit A [Verrucomicrobiales bacterium]
MSSLTLRLLASRLPSLRAAFLSALLWCPSLVTMAAESHAAPAAEGHAAEAVHGLPAGAPVVFDFGFFQITNSMVLTWAVAIALILFAQIATRNIQAIPQGLQNFWEWLVESLHDFLEGIMGADLVKKTFWFFATIFLFILTCNWFGLIPGVGSIGWGHPDAAGQVHHLSHPLLRGVNADLNMTLAMSMVFSVCWLFWALGANGPAGFIKHIFGAKGDTAGLLKVLMVVVFAAVGVLEVISILFRPVSLSFRLYGNIFAGENMIETMAALGGSAFGWLLLLPFYFLELMVGLVQALVFMLLTSVFTLLICQHDEEHGHAHEAEHGVAKH